MSAMNEGPECQQKHVVKKDDHYMQFHENKPNYNLVFYNADGDEIGRLDFNGPGLAFEGIADMSAITFMDWISQVFRGRLEAEYQRGFEEGKKHATDK